MWIILFGCMLFLFVSHPLWVSLSVFIISFMIALMKMFDTSTNSLFVYLFIMVYSGGLLLMLMYMSSLVPNYEMSTKPKMVMLLTFSIIILCVYTDKFFYLNENLNYSSINILALTHMMGSKEIMYSMIFLLLFSFCVISSILSMFKYPVRSL